MKAIIETNKGEISIELFSDVAPLTVSNFVNLARIGYYNGLSFHRVITDFMIQGGCPDGNGMGGPGYRFQDEFDSSKKHNKPGILSMANSGPGTNGSQFFITHVETPWLDNRHTVFGEVVSESDQEVVNLIGQGDEIKKVTIEGDYSELFEKNTAHIESWNQTIKDNFPNLFE